MVLVGLRGERGFGLACGATPPIPHPPDSTQGTPQPVTLESTPTITPSPTNENVLTIGMLFHVEHPRVSFEKCDPGGIYFFEKDCMYV